jgi:hypothetical protein
MKNFFSFFKKKEGFTFPPPYKMAYVSTWDDGTNILSFENIENIITKKELKIPLTLFIETNAITNNKNYKKRYKKLVQKGNYIGSHSLSHFCKNKKCEIDLIKIDTDEKEYTQSKKIIQNIFGNYHGNVYAYPFGKKPKNEGIQKIIRENYICSRYIKTGFFTKGSDLNYIPVIYIENIKEKDIIKSIKNNYAIITLGHGIEPNGGYNPVQKKVFTSHLETLKKYKNDIWFTNLYDLIKYLKDTKQIK